MQLFGINYFNYFGHCRTSKHWCWYRNSRCRWQQQDRFLLFYAVPLFAFFQHKADGFAREGSLRGIDICHLGALLIQALRVAIPTILVAMYIGTGAEQSMLDAIPPVITGGLQIAGGFIVVVGYAMVINMMQANYLMPFFFLDLSSRHLPSSILFPLVLSDLFAL